MRSRRTRTRIRDRGPVRLVLTALALLLLLSKPFLETWVRRRAPGGQWTGYQRSYRWAAGMSALMLVVAVLLFVLR